MRTQYDEQLAQLDLEVSRMGALCEQAIAVATKALLAADTEAASQVAPLEAALDEKERAIEALCLRLFLQQQGKILSRNDLLSQVWGVAYLGESRTVDMHIKTLRQKLGDAGRYIETVIGLGYRLSGAAG